jgi:hypothetical protein
VGGRGRGHSQCGGGLYVFACLAERGPVVIAARLAAEIAAGRTAYLVALRQASHAISEDILPRRRLGRSP